MRNHKIGMDKRYGLLFFLAPLILALALLLLVLPVEGTSAQFDEKSWDFERFDVDIQLH